MYKVNQAITIILNPNNPTSGVIVGASAITPNMYRVKYLSSGVVVTLKASQIKPR